MSRFARKPQGKWWEPCLPPCAQPVLTCPPHAQYIQDTCPCVLSSQDLFFSLMSLALPWYPARHPLQGCMVSFKLCYYGNGRDVTIPLAWIIKSEGEVEGSRAQWTRPLCPHTLRKNQREGAQLLQLVFIRTLSLPADALKEAREIGAGEDSLGGSVCWSRESGLEF